MSKELVITIKVPLPDIGKMFEGITIQAIKKMFPTDKLPKGSTVDYEIKEIDKVE